MLRSEKTKVSRHETTVLRRELSQVSEKVCTNLERHLTLLVVSQENGGKDERPRDSLELEWSFDPS
jgi:hypothetical protein